MIRRLAWVAAAPLLSLAVIASATYAAAVWAADLVMDADPFNEGDDQ